MNLKSCYIIGNLFFFTLCSLRAQEASVIKIDEPLSSMTSSHTKHQATWSIVAAPKMLHAYMLKDHSGKEHDSEDVFSAEVELQRKLGRWHNAIGVDLIEESFYGMQGCELIEGKFPIGVSAYGEYSLKTKSSFVSVGPQVAIGSSESIYCIVRLQIGSPIDEFKASVGVQFIVHIAKEL